ncbi:Facilitated trehalose transporter Tret1-2 homolog [Eumeta japonica]|uniref:Facilitated trehalose transporter Tret1-2 homolog n=1 Tax=Eumeta variegata TaxID=151549 RepID=A0A4C1YMY7_EUMVA|nr:Facilitated trehalose transporter Tret1-2 homolog [Eumeta japonica]
MNYKPPSRHDSRQHSTSCTRRVLWIRRQVTGRGSNGPILLRLPHHGERCRAANECRRPRRRRPPEMTALAARAHSSTANVEAADPHGNVRHVTVKRVRISREPRNDRPPAAGRDLGPDFSGEAGRRRVYDSVLAALAAQSINISVGFCQGFSAVLLPQYTQDYANVTNEQTSWIGNSKTFNVSIPTTDAQLASLGVISNPIGALLGGMMVDAVGRRLLLQSIVLPNLIGWLVIAFSETYVYLCVGRFITGFTIGMSTVSYIYVVEITTPEKRGILSALGPTLVSTGIFIVYALGAFVHWRKIAAICAGFSLLTPFLMYFAPESPLWLASKGQMKEAYNAMFWLRQNTSMAQQELVEFTRDRKSNESMTFKDKMSLFRRRNVLKPFVLLILFFIFQEMSGIYVILYYAVDFFRSVVTDVNAFTASIIVGGVRVFMGVVGACLINSFRRKTLATASGLLLGATMLGAAICDSLKGPPLVKLACILLHVSFSMVGFLQLPWIMSGELYPQDIRGVMSGATTCCAYVLIFFNIKTYPKLEKYLTSNGTLYLFGGCALLGAIYCLLFLPETKGKSLSEIMRQFDESRKDGDPEAVTDDSYHRHDIVERRVQRRHSAGASISLEKKDELFAPKWNNFDKEAGIKNVTDHKE